jgi:hypothetical protein
VVDHGEEELDRNQHRDRRPPGQCLADRVGAAYRDVRGEACGGADDERDPRNRAGGPPGATLRHQVEARDEFEAVHAGREGQRFPAELVVFKCQFAHVREADRARHDGQAADE